MKEINKKYIGILSINPMSFEQQSSMATNETGFSFTLNILIEYIRNKTFF